MSKTYKHNSIFFIGGTLQPAEELSIINNFLSDHPSERLDFPLSVFKEFNEFELLGKISVYRESRGEVEMMTYVPEHLDLEDLEEKIHELRSNGEEQILIFIGSLEIIRNLHGTYEEHVDDRDGSFSIIMFDYSGESIGWRRKE